MSAARLVPFDALRRLVESDRDAVLSHLLRLSEDDRWLRFLQTTSDAMLANYVAAIDFDAVACFGIFDDADALRALAEGIPGCGVSVEAAFTTDLAWRGWGLAHALFEAISRWSATRGGARIVLHCDARNRPMRALLKSFDAEVEVDGMEVHAVCHLHALASTLNADAIAGPHRV